MTFIHHPLACLTVIAFAFSLLFVYDATRPALHLSNGDVTTLSLDRSRRRDAACDPFTRPARALPRAVDGEGPVRQRVGAQITNSPNCNQYFFRARRR